MRNSLVIARPSPSPVPQEIVDLADKSLDIGYRVLANRVQKISAFHEGTTLLKGIGVNVYDEKSVVWYQKVAIFKAKYLLHVKYLVYMALLVPLAYALARMAAIYQHPSFAGIFFGVTACFAAAFAVVSLVAYIVQTNSREYILSWDSTSLESYNKPIPEEALRTAITIKEEWPKAEFIVEELRSRKRVIDPFLYVVYKGVRLYVSVWGEPKFTGSVR